MANEANALDTVLAQALDTRARLSELEDSWKALRAQSRALALQLMIDHGWSVNRTSTVTGHGRQTLTVWLAVAGGKSDETDA